MSGKVVERFWSFCDLPQGNAENISANVISCLKRTFPDVHDKQQRVSQCYDGASVKSGQHRGVQSIVKEAYPNSHYVYCYAHQLNRVLQQATKQIDNVREFFAHLNALSVFFFTLLREYHALMIVLPWEFLDMCRPGGTLKVELFLLFLSIRMT